MEVNMEGTFYARPQINGKNQFYYTYDRENKTWSVMRRFKTREDKIYKVYKTERGAKNAAFHNNLHWV